ncbi:hypothetical protein ACB092_12G014300 [Castanea dentata]
MCQSGLETSGHMFWECERVREAWALLKIFPAHTNIQFLSFMDLLWYGVFEAKWDALQLENIVIVTWALWRSRNEARTGGEKKSVSKTVNDALEYLAEYQACVKDPDKKQLVWVLWFEMRMVILLVLLARRFGPL